MDYLKAVRASLGGRRTAIPLAIWAKRLGYRSPRSLEQILAGDRQPSSALLFRLARELKLSALEQKYLDLMVQRERRLRKRQPIHELEAEMDRLRPTRYQARYINNEIFKRVSEWYPLVIRQLSHTPRFKKDIAWIRGRLRDKVSSSQAAAALAEWERLALDQRSIYTHNDVPSAAVRTFHKKMLQKAIEAIDEVPMDEREYGALTFRCSKAQIPKLKEFIRAMRDQANKEFFEEDGDEVFQLCLAMFPHTALS